MGERQRPQRHSDLNLGFRPAGTVARGRYHDDHTNHNNVDAGDDVVRHGGGRGRADYLESANYDLNAMQESTELFAQMKKDKSLDWMYGPSHLQRFVDEMNRIDPSRKGKVRIASPGKKKENSSNAHS